MRNRVWNIRLAVLVAAICCASTAAAQAPRSDAIATAGEAYLAFSRAVAEATLLDQVLPYLSRDALAMLGGTPDPGEAAHVLTMLQALMPSEITIVGSTQTNHGIELRLSGGSMGSVATGVVLMVREDGAWKIGHESWRVR